MVSQMICGNEPDNSNQQDLLYIIILRVIMIDYNW